jgi:deazaflavin-dependent oxidoreductase (nitroreductase family)
MKKIKEISRPQGLSKWLFKLPVVFYAVGLGSLMGKRFIQINHIGRRSGKEFRTVVEVVKYDQELRKIHVASGFGEKSDWLRNISRHPEIEVNFHGIVSKAKTARLQAGEAENVLLDYTHRYPFAMRELARFMGYEIDGSDADIRLLAAQLPIVEIQLV